MILIRSGLFLAVSSLLLFACSSESKEVPCDTPVCEQQQLYDDVITIHDVVMPKLSQISSLKSQIEDRMEVAQDSIERAEWLSLMLQLDRADESMWVWMRQFKPEMDSLVTEKDMNYLQQQLAEVEQVAEKINSSIAESEQALK